MTENNVAVIVGVGPGLGAALARRFARAGFAVAVAARKAEALASLASTIDGNVRAYGCDATEEAQVENLFAQVARDLGPPLVAIFNSGGFVRKSLVDSTLADFEQSWRGLCLGGFLTGRAAARAMLPREQGTILFTGATASLRGGAQFQNFAVGKFGLRALAQSMARELQPKGIHVAHVIIDGPIESARSRAMAAERGPDGLLAPDAIAETYYRLHCQARSAWTHELDLRPWTEKF